MLNFYPRMPARSGDGDDDGNVDGYRVFYGIAVVCICILLFCVLAASVGVRKVCAFAALAALLLSVVGCVAPKTWVHRRGRPASAMLALTAGGTRARPAPGRATCAPANAPPAFAYACPLEGDGGSKHAAASGLMCSVCLEDVHGGEMVRQVPACRHVFHEDCIDMWLHSHGTCPMCRCVITPPAPMVAAKAAAEEVPESSKESSASV